MVQHADLQVQYKQTTVLSISMGVCQTPHQKTKFGCAYLLREFLFITCKQSVALYNCERE